jgi:formylglycine-generating enzyme required for sulfatase activity
MNKLSRIAVGVSTALFVVAPSVHAETSVSAAVSIDWVTIGGAGNAGDTEVMNDGTSGYGAVDHVYLISRTEVTNAQYAMFLNAVAQVDPYQLYHPFMDPAMGIHEGSGIVRSGTPGTFTYEPTPGQEDWPVNYVSVFDAMRFANWLHNGMGDGETETGAYTLLGGTPIPSNGYGVTRNADAKAFLPTEDEWYKAAYYDPATQQYYDYPAASDTVTTCSTPGPTPNTANCEGSVGTYTAAGAYTGSPSPNGTFDQGGNLHEWCDTITAFSPPNPADGQLIDMLLGPDRSHISVPASGVNGYRGLRGGSGFDSVGFLAASSRNSLSPESEFAAIGFRIATVGL